MPTTGVDASARLAATVAVLQDASQRVFLCWREPGKHQGGKWEFPGGKCEPGETPVQALRRELKEELDLEVGRVCPLITIPYDYPDRQVLLHTWLVQDWRGNLPGSGTLPNHVWVSRAQLHQYPQPDANRGILRALELPRLCAIVQVPAEEDSVNDSLKRIEPCLAAGLRLLYLRGGDRAAAVYLQAAQRISRLAGAYDARLLLDARYAETVQSVPCAGLHLGTELLRRSSKLSGGIGAGSLLSAACHNATELERALKVGADLILLSPVLATSSHPGRPPLGWEQFRALVSRSPVPVYALGGMEPAHLRNGWSAGAQGLAMLSALRDAADPAAIVRACEEARRSEYA